MKRGHETNDEEGEGDAKGKGENVKAEGGAEERKIEDGLFIFLSQTCYSARYVVPKNSCFTSVT